MDFYTIGSREIVLAFKLTGIDGTVAETRDEVLEAFNSFTKRSDLQDEQKPRILILTEDAAALIEKEEYEWQKTGKYPLVVEVPGLKGHAEGRKSLSEAIRQAVGISV
ncbi:MAG: V-type ATP synthase subunit F [Treponema sp.]|nr:V-type ATP synthase subunit F [Treponema sp.]